MAQPAHAPAAPLSSGTLFYVWGERVLPPGGRLGNTVLPSGAKVSAKQLSPLLFAVSCWRLRDDGALRLQEVTKKSMGLFKQQHVQLEVVGQPNARAGYDDVILRGVAGGAATAYDVVRGWFGRDALDPDDNVFSIARQEMVETGLARTDANARSGVSGLLLGKAKVEPVPEAIRATEAEFSRLHAGWEQFARSEAALAGALTETCSKAIRSRQQSDS